MKLDIEKLKSENIDSLNEAELNSLKLKLNNNIYASEKIAKISLYKFIYNTLGYIAGLTIGACIGRIMLNHIYNGSFYIKDYMFNIILAVILTILTIISHVALYKSKAYSKNLKTVCSNKIDEIDKKLYSIKLNSENSNNQKEAN